MGIYVTQAQAGWMRRGVPRTHPRSPRAPPSGWTRTHYLVAGTAPALYPMLRLRLVTSQDPT